MYMELIREIGAAKSLQVCCFVFIFVCSLGPSLSIFDEWKFFTSVVHWER